MKLLIPDNCWGWKLTSLFPHTREATLLPWISTKFLDLENKEHYSFPESPPHHNHRPMPRHEAVMRPLAPPCPHLLPLLAWIAALLPSLPNLFIFKVRQNCATTPYHGNFGICLGCSSLPNPILFKVSSMAAFSSLLSILAKALLVKQFSKPRPKPIPF